MCRLFGLSAGSRSIRATFWLLDAPDSLSKQSRDAPDGTGLGTFDFDTGPEPRVEKQKIAAKDDLEFAEEAKERHSTTFVAHIRRATTGGKTLENTHPFEQHRRIFAHNGAIEGTGDDKGLGELEKKVGDSYMKLVKGETDSERFFALITGQIDAHGGDIGAGITSAVRWVADNMWVYALNIVLTTPTDLFALRYPAHQGVIEKLWVLERAVGGQHGHRHLEHASAAGRVRVRSGELAHVPAVVIATEKMDENRGWRLLESGELLHVDENLQVDSTIAIDYSPVRQLIIKDHKLVHDDSSPCRVP